MKMSKRGSNTTADRLEWHEATALVRKLYKDGDFRMSLLIGAGIFFGLRASDLRQLTWRMLLGVEGEFELVEKKTGKRRVVKVNKDFKTHIQKCYDALKIENEDEPCFLSKRGTIMSIQRMNVLLKSMRDKYHIKCKHFSTHSLRKTFGRTIYENSGQQAELALAKLSSLFNHSNPAITRRYLGITKEELLQSYDLLDF